MALNVGTFPVLKELPDAYYPVIGRIMMKWSYLENLLRDCAYMLLRVDRKEGRIAVRSPRASDMVTMIEELLAHNSLPTKVNTKELKKALVITGGARDALAHGVWVDHEESEGPVLQVISGSYPIEPGQPAVKARIDPVAMSATPDELKLTIRDINRFIEAVETLRKEIVDFAGPLPDISHRQ